jgi:hypothetical protein
VEDSWSEAGYSNQNPVENLGVKWVKQHGKVLMNRTGCFDFLWLEAHQYLAEINNICADESLEWMVPRTKRHGTTEGISAYLGFQFFQKVMFLDDGKFPGSKEKPGYWMGPSKNVGDILTYKLYSDETKTFVDRSVIRSVDGTPHSFNKRKPFDVNLDPDITLDSENANVHPQELEISKSKIPITRKHKRQYKLRTAKHKVRWDDTEVGDAGKAHEEATPGEDADVHDEIPTPGRILTFTKEFQEHYRTIRLQGRTMVIQGSTLNLMMVFLWISDLNPISQKQKPSTNVTTFNDHQELLSSLFEWVIYQKHSTRSLWL